MFWAACKRIREINLELVVTPATNIPMIKITIDNSINEKALDKILDILFKKYF